MQQQHQDFFNSLTNTAVVSSQGHIQSRGKTAGTNDKFKNA
jgi:hypothetical protein